MSGLLAVDRGFEILCERSAIGRRRYLDTSAVSALKGFSDHYAHLLSASRPAAGLLKLGQELYSWLDGDDNQLARLLQQADRPLRFEIRTADRYPAEAEWALLRAPWELLADEKGFLANDVGLGFSPVRRLGERREAPPLDPHRLGLVFMAASPRGAVELDYEAEETAIMAAVGSTRLDLLVEESGNPDELGERLTEYEAMQALHLSCHGDNAWQPPGSKPDDKPRPALLLETPEGEVLPTDADRLIGTLRAHRPRLVFLSACLTAAPGGETRSGLPGDKAPPPSVRGGVAYSLAEALVNAGLPAVLGWNGPVADVAATAFAKALYDGLEGRQDLADAVATARRDLLNATEEAKRRDWHLARLWLGPQGGGPIVGGSVRRRMMPATHGHKQFLDAKGQKVPVASHEMFVGRRRELQKALRVLRDGVHAGVLLHGMGRLGKSSLAARIANRRRDLRLAVVFEYYGALDVLAALAEALKDCPKARDLLRHRTDQLRLAAPHQQPDLLQAALIDLLRGPCGQMEADGTPVLLVIDDLEQILEADPAGGRHRVTAHAPVLAAVLRAFDAAINAGMSRLVITSRFPFTLDSLERRLFELPLPPLSEAAQRKLELRQKEAAADAGFAGTAFDERKAMLTRVPGIARGNPGLQDLIGRRLILSATVPVERARKTLDEMEAWLKQGDLPSDAEVRAFLENLAVDALLDLAGTAGRAALRRLTLFDLPVPSSVADKLAGIGNASLPHLCDLGLIDVLADLVEHRRPAFAVNALAGGRLAPLNDSERSQLAPAVTRDLFVAWGGTEGTMRRPPGCDLQLTQLGLLAEDGEVVENCATGAVIFLRASTAAAAALGRAAIALLDARHRVVPWRLLSETAAEAAKSGDGKTADMLLERGIAALEEQRRSGAVYDPAAAGFLVHEQARRLMDRGDLDRAKALFTEAARFAEAAGDELSATVSRGYIANILFVRGNLDEALRIRRDEELPAYERLGAVRSHAITMANIARILQRRSDLDAALRILREEVLPVFDRLGDVSERALTMAHIADILVVRGDLDGALHFLREEVLPVFDRLGEVRRRTLVMGRIADILYSRGDLDAALRIRQEQELPVFERLDDVRERAITMGKIADILKVRGDPDAALRTLRGEVLPVFERLGDVRSCAVTKGKIANILLQKRDAATARSLLEELLEIHRKLADAHGVGNALWELALLDLEEDKVDDAVRRITEAYDVVFELGHAEAIAEIGMAFGYVLAAKGQVQDARQVLRFSVEIYLILGREDNARQANDLIRQLGLE